MPVLLHIDSSPRAASVSSRLAAAFVENWRQQNPRGTVIHHNTTLERLPYLDASAVDAWFTPAGALSPEQKQSLAASDRCVDELLSATVIVLGVPMWNLGIPASLKAWIDLIVREGRTFAFTSDRVVPLIPPGKRVLVFSARGGAYLKGTPAAALDHLEPYLRAILGCIGLYDVAFIYADSQSSDPVAAAQGLARAEDTLAQLLV